MRVGCVKEDGEMGVKCEGQMVRVGEERCNKCARSVEKGRGD